MGSLNKWEHRVGAPDEDFHTYTNEILIGRGFTQTETFSIQMYAGVNFAISNFSETQRQADGLLCRPHK